MQQHTMNEEMSQEMQECIRNCQECHSICLTTMQHCLGMGGKHASPRHITTLLDCVQICQTSADFMLRNSPLHAQVCGVCIEACERCAQECEQMANGDRQMLECAAVCRRCADSCRRMASMAA